METPGIPLLGDVPSGSVTRFEAMAGWVGNTPLWQIPLPAGSPCRLFVKLEGTNPTGSVKDRACVAMLRAMISDPGWDPSLSVIDSSSGNMGCSLAYFGRILGVGVTIVSSSKLTTEKRFFMEYFGASVETQGEFTIEGNRYCAEIARSDPSRWYFLDQLHNPNNAIAHEMGTGPEILSQLPGLTAVVGSVGSGGTLLGVGRYLKRVDDQIKVIAVEAASGTRLPGTASLVDGDYRTPFIAEGFTRKVFDSSVQVSEGEAVAVARHLSLAGLFTGLQTYAVVAAALRAAESGELRGDTLLISGDTAWKNMDVLARKVHGQAGAATP
ncbi:MAG: pyridoxal-phosphate dependent enzyme [Nocardiopsaceae bacterium]|nr:pyridoxal-phosphate dependent enzyme [Nocardiopsaceae bacterium]